jgi:hypothetical protein
MQLVLSQANVVMNQYDMAIIEHTNGYNDDTRKYGETKPVYSIFHTDNCNESIGKEILTKKLDSIQHD